MANTIKFFGDLTIDLGEDVKSVEAVGRACKLIGMTCIGAKVSKKGQALRVIVKFHDTYFYVKDYCNEKMSKIIFTTIPYLPEEYEDAIEDGYNYYVSISDIHTHETYCFREKEEAEAVAAIWCRPIGMLHPVDIPDLT